MKKHGLIHPELSRILAELGHGDRICIADAGLPIPDGVPRVDLAYRLGAPSFLDVMETVAGEVVVEALTVATEASEHCPEILTALADAFPDATTRSVAHESFKAETVGIRAVIRTGETTPYANVLLSSGVPF